MWYVMNQVLYFTAILIAVMDQTKHRKRMEETDKMKKLAISLAVIICLLQVSVIDAHAYDYKLYVADSQNILSMCVLGVKTAPTTFVNIITGCTRNNLCSGISDTAATDLFVSCQAVYSGRVVPTGYDATINPAKNNKRVNCTISKPSGCYVASCVNFGCTLTEQ